MDKKVRQQVLDKYYGHCAYCGCQLTMKTLQVDHIKPILRGWEFADEQRGEDDIDNYFPSCAPCNRRKGTESVEGFRHELEMCHQRMMNTNANYRQLVRYGQIKLINDGKVEFYFEKVNRANKVSGVE